MTIRRERKKVRRADITTYDLEWRRESLDVTLCGAYDERLGYRWYQTPAQFLRGELVPGNSGRRFYAHYGGGADMVFLLRELAKLPSTYRIRGAFSGSAAIMVRVERGEHSWLFVDSFWTMRAKLAKIGEWLGLPKLDDKSTDDMTPTELRTYNERDCVILYQALQRFQEAILAVGGEMGITIASTALRTFLRRYLKRPIENGPTTDLYVEPAYTASRVERFRESCEQANYYDINSSFAYSMLSAVPGNMIGFDVARKGMTLPKAGLWFAEVALRVRSDFPPIPYRSKSGRIFYPNGEFRTTISSEDFACGDFEIEKVYSVMRFEERDDMAAYAEDFYKLRLQSGFEGQVYKFALTNLYGKFAEHPEKEVIIVNPDDNDYTGQTAMLTPGVVIQTETRKIPHAHVPISATITARSRRYLLEHIRAAARQGRVYYSDTDSVICDASLDTCTHVGSNSARAKPAHDNCDHGLGCKVLGGLKREYVIRRGRFVAPKLYALEKEDGSQEVKAKGFSRSVGILSPEELQNLPRGRAREPAIRARIQADQKARAAEGERVPLDYETFARLSEGHAAVIERMLRIRELIAADGIDYKPRTLMMTKTINPNLRPKRRPTADGGSEPWDVREIEDE